MVLLVDDEPSITELVALRLVRIGYRVHSVINGADALDWLQHHRADLVVSDLHMPFVGGLELCRAMVTDPSTADIPVLLLTADPGEIDVEGLVNLRGVVYKPFSVTQIVTKSVDLLGPATPIAEPAA
ncbi:MAG: two-component system response regulator [Phycisphaerales bacterium JB065]